jgi:hypothetical protein
VTLDYTTSAFGMIGSMSAPNHLVRKPAETLKRDALLDRLRLNAQLARRKRI